MTRLSEKRLFLLDMDGTIYLSETLLTARSIFCAMCEKAAGGIFF